MSSSSICRRRLLAAALLAARGAAAATVFRDPLDMASTMVKQPAAAPLMAMVLAGTRLVGVGLRGMIVVSDDQGRSWRQMASPVQSDLTAVHFPTAAKGWAVGHDGVILHSADGGLTWLRQLDGRAAAEGFKADYEARLAVGEVSAADVKQLALNFQAGASLPYLAVWFADERNGWVVGSFGMIAATRDGGRTWQPWLHRIDNPNYLNLNGIRAAGRDVFIAGEQGQVYCLERDSQRFSRRSTGYAGSLFGISGTGGTVLAYGLRGTVYRSGDRGATWSAMPAVTPVTVTDAVFADDRRVFMANVASAILASNDAGVSFHALPMVGVPGMTGLVLIQPQRLVTYGLQGIKVVVVSADRP